MRPYLMDGLLGFFFFLFQTNIRERHCGTQAKKTTICYHFQTSKYNVHFLQSHIFKTFLRISKTNKNIRKTFIPSLEKFGRSILTLIYLTCPKLPSWKDHSWFKMQHYKNKNWEVKRRNQELTLIQPPQHTAQI